ncbi:MAG: DUF4233 domain-containing protein [Actinobacteria bacterium]|nr:DUF4233 domain-containing protein [Actinomycetota bacterium]
MFASTVLGLEALVVFFATLVAFGLRVAPPGVVWTAGAVLAVALVLMAGSVRRPGGYLAGSVGQAFLVAAALVVPLMAVIAVIFVVLWVLALVLGGRVDAERAAWDAEHVAPADAPGGPAPAR